jgi:hypothetical protein
MIQTCFGYLQKKIDLQMLRELLQKESAHDNNCVVKDKHFPRTPTQE